MAAEDLSRKYAVRNGDLTRPRGLVTVRKHPSVAGRPKGQINRYEAFGRIKGSQRGHRLPHARARALLFSGELYRLSA
jgi:hypothetical protein